MSESPIPSCADHPDSKVISAKVGGTIDTRVWTCLRCGKAIGAAPSAPSPDYEPERIEPGEMGGLPIGLFNTDDVDTVPD